MNDTKKRASSIERRLSTPLSLTFNWFLASCFLIGLGLFFILNWLIAFALESVPGHTLWNFITTVRIPNTHNSWAVRLIYYIDLNTVRVMLIPAIIIFAVGSLMQVIRYVKFNFYVNGEINKSKKLKKAD